MIKVVLKSKKPALKFERDDTMGEKEAQSETDATMILAKLQKSQ